MALNVVSVSSALAAEALRSGRWPRSLALVALMGAALAIAPCHIGGAEAASKLKLAAVSKEANEAEMGQYSPLVRMIQVHLAERGLYNGPVGGTMTPETEKAIKAYQEIVGLTPDGVPSETLLNKLNSTQGAAKELVNKLDAARKKQIIAARAALEKEFGPDWAHTRGTEHRAATVSVDSAACFAAPEPECLISLALSSAKRIQKDDLRDWALSHVVEAQVHASLRADALETARSITDPRSVIAAVGSIAVGLARSGQTGDAVEAAARVPDDTLRDKALRAVAEGQASVGEAAAAAETAGRIDAPAERLPALIASARAEIEAGQIERARALRDKAAADLKALKRGSLRDFATGLIAELDAELGNVAAAKALTEEIRDRSERSKALAEIATIEARAGKSAAAGETLISAQSGLACPIERADCQHAHARLAITEAELGRHEAAMAVVNELKPGYTRLFAHSGVAVATARAGLTDDATRIADRIPDIRARLDALIGIAEAVNNGGDTARALAIEAGAATLARTIENPVERAFSLIDLARLAARTGAGPLAADLLKEATAIARDVDDPFGQTRSFSRIAVALSSLGGG